MGRAFGMGLCLLAVWTASVTLLGACGGGDGDGAGDTTAAASGRNLLANGGFEEGREPWFSIRPPDWILADVRSLEGTHSALLQMRDNQESPESKVYYLVQEITPVDGASTIARFPDVVSGNYFVENWVRGTKKQYLQFVVIVFGGDSVPTCPDGNPCPNYQIRYIEAGIDEDPFAIGNAKFVYLTKEDPAQGEWVHVERNVAQDFLDLWGAVPANFNKIRLLFEVRYDDKSPSEGPIEADVYYDDLFTGTRG
jgi:hypothetical protein